MKFSKMKRILSIAILVATAWLLPKGSAVAQVNNYHSVLSEHTWHRLSVTQEGVYQLDYATLQAMGMDMDRLNPDQIRMFGNPSGKLPEKNSATRPDDLTEMAIVVEGAEDGSFDEGDKVLFYGQEPTRWNLLDQNGKTYQRERNYYSDTTYYYLCVDSGVDGLRVGEKSTLAVEDATTVISDFPDYLWHEAELFSPYFLGQNWWGERIGNDDPPMSIPFVFPNLVTNKPTWVKARVYGRVKGGYMYYDAFVGDNQVASHEPIKQYKDHYYGFPSSFEKQIALDGDTALFVLSFSPDPNASLYLDYVELYAWRQLKRVGDMFPFRLLPSQFGNGKTAVWVQNTNANYRLWEVTEPLQPVVQAGVLSGGNMVFATNEKSEKRYVMFKPSAAMDVVHWTPIPNQDLHSIALADNLILTSPIFLEQAQELADYHAELDGMTCVVVDVNEIYNEFSTGTPDPTGIRDFVRMVYRRSAGRLRYLTLFGRASADFRDIMGYGQNYVPCYEAFEDSNLELSMCTDDYFGLMDNNEGVNSDGKVDIGIGRISVSTVEDAENVLRKIRHFNDLMASHGEWKTDYILCADDETLSYVENSETLYRMLDTICPDLTAKKVYCGAYPVVNTSNGSEIPGANKDLMDAFDKGALAMLYTGHGGVRGLTGDNVFTNADIAALANYDKMPFVYTATCEFTKYDNPLLVSAGEQMLLNPQGGCVALFTTCRPTYGTYNVKHSKALMGALTQRDEEGKPLRFGDIVRLTKCDPLNYFSSTNPLLNMNICFMFMGDPVLRFPMPQEEVELLTINGASIGNNDDIQLHAMSMVTVEGVVKKVDGTIDGGFNGILWARFFDKKTKVNVKFVGSSPRNVYYYKDVLYQGKVSVKNGRFSLSFQVPKDIAQESGMPRFSFYAYDSINNIDAMGKFDNLTLGGYDPSAVADDQGPTIQFYWNSPDFVDGQSVERQGVLYADLYDAQGIYHYDYSLGRDIVLNSNLMGYNSMVLNEHFEPALDDFRRGRVSLPVSDLKPGTYAFNLKVWDTQDNASEANLWFVVDEDLFLSQVHNYPNPFSDETYITLTHVGEDGIFDVNVEIFDVMGRRVAQINRKVSASNGVIEPLRWGGYDQFGQALRSGVYLYRLTLTDEDGYYRTVSQKMVIER